jgi:multiple antibiotic resistance protein
VLELAFNAFVTLLVVIDPLGLAPLFVGLTRGYAKDQRRAIAVRGVLLGAGILLVFALVGDVLLGALGIGLAAFRIAGGALLFLLALEMVFARPSGTRARGVEDEGEPTDEEDVSVFPLAIPLIAGPGAITTVLLYTGGAGPVETVEFLGVLATVLLLTLAALLVAPRLVDLFGRFGANVLSRVLGVLLAALAVQFVLDGVRESFGL